MESPTMRDLLSAIHEPSTFIRHMAGRPPNAMNGTSQAAEESSWTTSEINSKRCQIEEREST